MKFTNVTMTTYEKQFTKNAEQILNLMNTKTKAQYAQNDSNPLINFIIGSTIKYRQASNSFCYETLKDYVLKHLAHFQKSNLHTSKLKESLLDIATYCIIAATMVDINAMSEADSPVNSVPEIVDKF